MLEQLPNGDWIDLREVVGLRMLPRSTPSPPFALHPPRVCVDLRNSVILVIGFESNEEAETYRDVLAQKVNQAQQNTILNKEDKTPKTA